MVAQDVLDRLVEAGITSVLNFAPTVLNVPADVYLRKVDLAVELQILGYYEHLRSGRRAETGGPAHTAGAR
jgi:redox-sensing transcriptional repressor